MKLKIGDTVQWRGSWGEDAPVPAKVTAMEITKNPREKSGEAVNEVDWDIVNENRVIVDLDNGHWAYGSQIAHE
jgi:hypothetical protein